MWPLLGILVCICIALHVANRRDPPKGPSIKKSDRGGSGDASVSVKFASFQRKYIVVYLTCVLGDWLQGPTLFALYEHYGLSLRWITALYAVDSLSSMLLGAASATIADKLGRRFLSMWCAVIYCIASALKFIPSIPFLLLSAVGVGVANALLGLTFETWMVSEHQRRGFNDDWLPRTFSLIASGEGAMAITAGLLAHLAGHVHMSVWPTALEDGHVTPPSAWRPLNNGTFVMSESAVKAEFVAQVGLSGAVPSQDLLSPSPHVWPFAMAAILFPVAAVLIRLTWTENYGIDTRTSLQRTFQEAWRALSRGPRLLYLGASQACFFAGIYIFVFLWTPFIETIHAMIGWSPPQLGLLFGCLMVSSMTGSAIFQRVSLRYQLAESAMVMWSYIGGAGAFCVMICCAWVAQDAAGLEGGYQTLPAITVAAFVVLECCFGIYMPCAGVLRSRVIPDHMHAATMGLFQLPLNAVVILMLWVTSSSEAVTSSPSATNLAGGASTLRMAVALLVACLTLMLTAAVCHRKFERAARAHDRET